MFGMAFCLINRNVVTRQKIKTGRYEVLCVAWAFCSICVNTNAEYQHNYDTFVCSSLDKKSL